MDDSQHFATQADIERMRADLIERMGELERRMVGRIAEREVGAAERAAGTAMPAERPGKRMARWMIGLFVAQTAVLIETVLGMIEVLR